MGEAALTEILAGALSSKIGALPKVESPGENTPLLLFVRTLLPLIKDEPIYRRDNVVVLPDDEGARVAICKPSTFRSWVDRYIAPYRLKKDKETGITRTVVKTITREVAEGVLDSADFWPHLRKIMAVNPVARPSIAELGAPLILQGPGYDATTQTLTFKSAINSYDEKQTLREATNFIRELLVEYPFSDWVVPTVEECAAEILLPGYFQSRSQAVQVAAMLSQFAINCVPRDSLRMAFVFNANAQRSGKSLLCKMAVVPVNGKMASQSYTSKDEDLRKVIDAEMIRASNYITFDNVKTKVQSQVIEALMTAPTWTGRVLGKSEMFDATNTASLYFTGNQIKLSSDVSNRCLFVDLFVAQANVQERTVESPIDDSWLMKKENRIAILTALWTIVREWDKAGRPKPKTKPRLGFEHWCNVIGGMVEFAGFGDCLAEPVLEDAGDNESMEINTFVYHLTKPEVWAESAHAHKLGKSDVVDEKDMPPRLEYTFQELANYAVNENLFSWIIEGKETKDLDDKVEIELNHDAVSKFGLLLHRYAPTKEARTFRLTLTKSVRFSCTGKSRARRFVLDL